MAKRAQGAFEYILMLGGVLLIAVLIFVILKATIWSGKQSVEANTETIDRLTCLPAYIGGRGVVGYWKLDETSGFVAKDSSGNGYDGTIPDDPDFPTSWGPGVLKGGMYLSEIEAMGFTIPANTAPKLPKSGSSFTIEAWIKTDGINPGGGRGIVNRDLAGPGVLTYYFIINSNGKLEFKVKNLLAQTGNKDLSGLNQWHHVAIAFNSQWPRSGALYVDGELDKSFVPLDIFNPDPGYSVTIGSSFKGTLDNVVIYNRALTAQEIKVDYLCGQNAYA